MVGFNLFDFDMPSNDAWKKEIKFPTSWTSTDFLTGREGWINSTKPGSGGNLENYLETYPFENYEVMWGLQSHPAITLVTITKFCRGFITLESYL